MDATNLMLSIVFGLAGMGFLMYAKSAGAFVAAGAGVALMVVPYFISNNIILIVVGAALVSVPFVFRGQ